MCKTARSRRMLCAAFLYSLGPAEFTFAQDSTPAGDVDETRWFKNVRQLTKSDMKLARAGEGYFSPDGKRVCFQAYPEGQNDYQIYVMNVDGTGMEMVSTGTGATTCAYFHPDNKRLLFGSNHLDTRAVAPPTGESAGASGRNYNWSFYPGMDIFEYRFADKSLMRLTDAPGYDAEGSYSPDGKSIVFTSMRDGDQEIYIMNADGKSPRRITSAKGYDGGPFFSPDGKQIVYRSDRKGDGNLQIFVNNLEGSAERGLTDGDSLHWCPFWHPSGKWLIYTHGVHGPGKPAYDLHLLSADGKQDVRITSHPEFDGLPVFSPDGKTLMWTAKRNGISSAQLFLADLVGLTPGGELTR